MTLRVLRSVRVRRAAAAAAALGVAMSVVGPVGDSVSFAAAGGGAFSATKTVTRTNLNPDGTQTTVLSKTVHVSVSDTTGLRGRQNVDVTWSGAQPTGGIQPDYNSTFSPAQEYPMVILQCRGVDATSVPASQRVSPETCWTHGAESRFQSISFTPWAPWRLDRYAPAKQRDAVYGRPSDATNCPSPATTEHWVPFQAVDGTSYGYGNSGCAGVPPEDFLLDSSAQLVPPNATFAATGLDGRGSTKFDIWSAAEDASLGCSAQVQCSLEIIPIVGVSCDPAGISKDSQPLPAEDIPSSAQQQRASDICEAGASLAPGSLAGGGSSPSLSVSGDLWWSASNWRNRISVPLQFAPVSNACSQVSPNASSESIYGSEVMNEATAQWAPRFCQDKSLFKLTHVQTAEPLARNLLTDPLSGVHAALSLRPPDAGFTAPTVQAPTAVSGFAISYTIDDANGQAVTDLKMTPRLLAKLMTESYLGDDFSRFTSDPQFTYLSHNPINITDDPEFKALNPNINVPAGTVSAATLIMLSADSDTMYDLTSYIESDPEARAFLAGKPDPWGMVVNKNYKGLALPVSTWPLLDTTLPNFNGSVACADTDPTPWLPLIANPAPSLATVTADVQFASPSAKTKCVPLADQAGSPHQWAPVGRMQPGLRFVIGLTTLGEAQRYDLNTAALQTSSTVSPSAQFTDASGRTFVSPTDASVRAAVQMFQPDETTRSWTIPWSAYRSAAGSAAYPGTLLVYTDVPTTGLDKKDADNLANFLRYAAGPGQTAGSGIGQLPAGYLPMTGGNGLDAMVSYTLRAADAVEHQTDSVPTLHPQSTPPSSSPPSTSTSTSTHTGSTSGSTHTHPAGSTQTQSPGPGGGNVVPPAGNTGGGSTLGATTPAGGAPTGASSSTSGGAPAAAGSSSPSVSLAADHPLTPGVGSGPAGVLLIVLLALAVLGGLGAAAIMLGPESVGSVRTALGRKHR